MSEINIDNIKPTIEDIVLEKLTGNAQKNALNFITYMKTNGITSSSNHFEFAGDYVCQIITYIDNGIPGWVIFMGGYDSVLCRREYQNFPVDHELKEFAWANVNHCDDHGCGTQPGKRISLFGKKINNLCTAILMFNNPDGESLELVKKLAVVWAQSNAHAVKNDKPYLLRDNEWSSVSGFGVHAGRSLDKVYTKSLNVEFYIAIRRRYVSDAGIGFSGGGWVPVTPEQIPVALHIGGHSARFRAVKEPTGDWTAVETLKYQVNVTYYVEMSIDITSNTYSTIIWMLDSYGDKDTPYYIAKNYPFRCGGDNPAVPTITTIETVYMGSDGDDSEFIIKDFKIVSGE